MATIGSSSLRTSRGAIILPESLGQNENPFAHSPRRHSQRVKPRAQIPRSAADNLRYSFRMRAVLFIAALFASLVPSVSARQENARELFNAGVEAQQRGDFETAIRDYRAFLAVRPDDFETKVNLGAALAHERQYDAAIAVYRSALPSAPQKDGVLLDLGLAYFKRGDFQNAYTQFETVHKSQPNNVRVAILLSDSALGLGKSSDAVALLAPLESENSTNTDFEYVLGSALISVGKRDEGVARIEKVAKATNSAGAYYLAGTTLLKMNAFAHARLDLDAALRLDPKLPDIYTLAGTARDNSGELQGAESAFREALKINPNDFTANLYLGAILYKRRQLDEAKTYLDHAVQLDPASSMARYETAMMQSVSGDYAAAAGNLEIVIKNDPNWLDPHVQLATLYYRLHRPDDGAKQRQIVQELTAKQQAAGPNAPGLRP
jgi:tetratricopeptide (TPR) repeat protein